MTRGAEKQFLLRAAKLYYLEDWPQEKIAQRFETSVATVCRALKQAKASGLVRVTICPPADSLLEEQLLDQFEQFGLRSAHVAGTTRFHVSLSAAQLFESKGRHRQRIVLDGGLTIKSFVQNLQPWHFEDLTVVPICADPPNDETSSFEVTTLLSSKFHVRKRYVIPTHVGESLAEVREKIRKIARRADWVFLGVAPFAKGFTPFKNLFHLGFKPEEIARKHREVFAVCGNFYLTRDGKNVPVREVKSRMRYALSFDELRSLALNEKTRVVAVVSSTQKTEAVRASLQSGIINTLIVDENLARALCKRDVQKLPVPAERP